MSEIVNQFLACVAEIEATKPTYRQPGDGSDAYRGNSLSGTVLMTYTRGESSSCTQL